MADFTIRVPADASGPVFLFHVTADEPKAAVRKARQLLREQKSKDGHLHVDLTFGLTGGKLTIPESAISEDGIIDIREDSEAF